MPDQPVYKELEQGHARLALELIQTLRFETQPMEGHSDPGAVSDCWDSLTEIVTLMAENLEPGCSAQVKPLFDNTELVDDLPF